MMPKILFFGLQKESKEEERPKEITKLAIGKPGGADFSDEEWEQIVELKCLECKKTLDQSKVSGYIGLN